MLSGLCGEHWDILRKMLAVSVNGDGAFEASGLGFLEAGLQGVTFATVIYIAHDHSAEF